jgi:DNA-binding SARP family transcriptional activator
VVAIELCGEVRLEVDGRRRERELPGRLGRILLGFLVLNRHRPVTRDELIDALWPSGAPEEARGTLSTLLSGLRRTLGPDIVTGRGELRLALPDETWVDVETAIADVRAARTASSATWAESALDVLERVLLPGFDAPWVDDRRRELDEERLTALELVARNTADPHRALAASRRLVALAPFRESGYALLMAAQEAQGNVAEALQTFERLRTTMRDELGTTPSPDLRAAHARLLGAGDSGPRLPEALRRLAERRFVGRAAVLRELHGHLAAGGRRFVFLAGEPGIGKSSAAAAFAREAEAIVLYGRSDEDAVAPYQPFVEMLAGIDDGRLMRGGAPAPEPPSGLQDVERYRLFEAVVATLARHAGDRALLLVCDDVHWADRPTLQLVRHLARAAAPERLLFLGTYRPAEAEPPLNDLIADLRREHVFSAIGLAGLDATEAAGLVGEDAARRLHETTGGNPLFLLAMRDEDDASIREVVLRRVARLGPSAREVLTLAAVAGQTFRPAVVDDVDVLDRAIAAGLLSETPDRLEFTHALIRQTLYEAVSETKRVHLHQRVAEALERLPRPEPAELAHHYFRARHVAAIRYSRAAAARAAESLAWEDAALHLERALQAGPDDLEDRVELLLTLGEVRMRGGHAAARAAFAEAAELARGRSPEQLARAAIGYAGRYYEAGVIDDTLIALLREALPGSEGELRARVLARLAEILHFAGDTEASIALSAEAVALARALGDEQVLAATLAGRHVSLLHVAHVDERMRVTRESLAIADRTGDPRLEMQTLQARVFDRLTLGDLAGGRQDLERLDALATALREPLFAHFVVGWRCTFAQIEGRLEDAERLALESYELRRRLETRDAESVLAAQLFMIRRAQGRVHELLPAVAQAVEQYPALAAWRAALPLVYVAEGDETRARHELELLVAGLDAIPRDFFWLTVMTLLSEGAAALNAPAAPLYDALAPFADRWVQIGYAASDGPVARSLGLLAQAGGDIDRATAHFEAALAGSAGAPAFEARARADLSACARTRATRSP